MIESNFLFYYDCEIVTINGINVNNNCFQCSNETIQVPNLALNISDCHLWFSFVDVDLIFEHYYHCSRGDHCSGVSQEILSCCSVCVPNRPILS